MQQLQATHTSTLSNHSTHISNDLSSGSYVFIHRDSVHKPLMMVHLRYLNELVITSI